MARYGKKAQSKVKKAMHERKAGTLKSGRSGKKVKSRKQAIAIGLSEARKAGGKVPKKSSSSKKKASPKRKPAAKKGASPKRKAAATKRASSTRKPSTKRKSSAKGKSSSSKKKS